MQKSMLILMILIGTNIKGMENEDDELMMKNDKKSILFQHVNKEGMIGAAGSGIVAFGIGKGLEKMTQKTDEKGEVFSSWKKEWTYGFSIVSMFLGGAITGKYYGEKEGIRIGEVRGRKEGMQEGREIGKKEASKLLKERRRNKYTSKIEEIQKRDDIDDIIKKFKIDEYLELIKDTENE